MRRGLAISRENIEALARGGELDEIRAYGILFRAAGMGGRW